jgi:hypothetical protein
MSPSGLRAAMADDLAGSLFSTDDFAEDVVYVPASGAERTIAIVVHRSQRSDHLQHQDAPFLTASVRNNAAAKTDSDPGGISLAELDPGRDKIRLAVRSGETATERVIHRVVDDHGAVYMVEIR